MSFLWAIYQFFLDPLLRLLFWVIIINAILSWLVAFNVVNPRNQVVSMIGRFTYAITDPLLRPLRRFIPPLGGVDITPIILILGIEFLRRAVLVQLIYALAGPPVRF